MAELQEAFGRMKVAEMRSALKAECTDEIEKKEISKMTKAACVAKFKRLTEDATHVMKWQPAVAQLVTMDALAEMQKTMLVAMQKMVKESTEKKTAETKTVVLDACD